MKIRTVNGLCDFLDHEFAWRRKELSALSNAVVTAGRVNKPTCIRAGVALLYAHWEGFVKNSAQAYLSFVSFQRLQYNELSPNLLALCFHGELVSMQETRGLTAHTDFAAFILTSLTSRAKRIPEERVQTQANLNSIGLRRIAHMLGLDFSPYELKQNLIDSQLLNWRNTIAHGRDFYPSEQDFNLLYHEVSGLLRTFKDQVSNAATLGSYRRFPVQVEMQKRSDK